MKSKYDQVLVKLQQGQFVGGPGINASQVIRVPTQTDRSVFGGPDPYLAGSWSICMSNQPHGGLSGNNNMSSTDAKTPLFYPVVGTSSTSGGNANNSPVVNVGLGIIALFAFAAMLF